MKMALHMHSFLLLVSFLLASASAAYVAPPAPETYKPPVPVAPKAPAPPVVSYAPPTKAPAPPVVSYAPPPKALVAPPVPVVKPPVAPYLPPKAPSVTPVTPYPPTPKAPSVTPVAPYPPTPKAPTPPAPAPYYGQGPPVKKQDCVPLCEKRCTLHSRKRLCVRACSTCCERCKCVPPGTYGNKEVCGRCYTDMTTHGGKPKCP